MRMLARQSLEISGFLVEEAEDGRQSLALFANLRPDIVLLDVHMPTMDGFTACEELRKRAGGENTPVLMMTALDDVGAIKRAYEVGATDFIHKPIQWTLLAHRVQYMLRSSQAVEDLRRSEAKLTNAQRLAQLASWERDLDSNELECSEEFYRIFGLRRQAFGGTYESFLRCVHREDRESIREAFDRACRERTSCEIDHRIVRSDGTERIVHQQAEVTADESGKPMRMIGTIQDITERKRAEEQIRFLAQYDTLTGLPNRTLFKEELDLALARARRHRRLVAILFLDLDRFKRINDTFGHSGGDLLLREVADRLLNLLRKTDSVARPQWGEPDALVARLGGDEFIILLSEIARVQDAAKVARRVVEALAEPFALNRQDVVATTSVGIALYPFDGDDADTLLKNADTAMYHAKDHGRNNYQFYTESMNATAFERLMLEGELRRALERGELVLHYQPQIDIASREVVGAEALLRWQHPEMGLVPPVRFISIAEEIGLIVPVGEWVLRTACEQHKAWEKDGLPNVRIAVNVSSRQFIEQDFVRTVARVLQATGVNPMNLDLELTESLVMEDIEASNRNLSELKELGVRLSVDDFGTGYSSLSYLRRLPLQALKIDRTFLKEIPENPDHVAITTAIIAMAKSLKLNVIAEGVESEAQLAFLKDLGCDEAQGFLISRALPPEEFFGLLTTRKAS
jgi:diguanylate cyclase (GGDEF)-like protein/PAS domain S-box-containing protein